MHVALFVMYTDDDDDDDDGDDGLIIIIILIFLQCPFHQKSVGG